MRFVIVSALLIAESVLASDLYAADDMMGIWATPGFGATVRLEPCEPEQFPVELCGTITWLWDVVDTDGAPRTDTKNRDRAARGTPLVGTRILSGFRRGQDDVWRGGDVYNPDNGRTYSGTIRLLLTGTLELKGCALKVFCQTQIWQRPADVCSAVGMN